MAAAAPPASGKKREKPRTAKEALQLRAKQKAAQAKPTRPSRGAGDERRSDPRSSDADVDTAGAAAEPASSPGARKRSGKARRAETAAPELVSVPPPPPPGLWARIKGFFGG